jgi:hypothetical protein
MERGDFIKIQNIKGLVLGTMLTVGLLVPNVHTIKDNGVCEASTTAGVISATVVDLAKLPTVENTEVEVVAEPEPQWIEMDVPVIIVLKVIWVLTRLPILVRLNTNSSQNILIQLVELNWSMIDM